MAKKIILIALFLCPSLTYASPDFLSKYGASNWIKFFETSSEKDYYNPKAITKEGNLAQIVELRDFSSEQMEGGRFLYMTKFHVYEYQCREQVFKVLYTQTRKGSMGKGSGVFEDSIPTPTYTAIKENTSVYQLWRIACLGG